MHIRIEISIQVTVFKSTSSKELFSTPASLTIAETIRLCLSNPESRMAVYLPHSHTSLAHIVVCPLSDTLWKTDDTRSEGHIRTPGIRPRVKMSDLFHLKSDVRLSPMLLKVH
jgi:hypothetical protein